MGNEIITAISTVGFPIVMCLLLLKIQRENDENHREQMATVVEALNNNTLALTKLESKFERKE